MKFNDLALLAENYYNNTERFINFMRKVTGISDSEIDDFTNWFVNKFSRECYRDGGLLDLQEVQWDDDLDLDHLESHLEYLRNNTHSAANIFDQLVNDYEGKIYNIATQHNNDILSGQMELPSTSEAEEQVASYMYDEYKKYKSLMGGLKAFKYRKPQ
jgi:hypothetical protein